MEQKLVRKVLQIEGMTCSSCEMRIENTLKKLDGVAEVKAMYSSSNVYITYDVNRVGLDRIIAEIEKLDYKVMYNKPSEQGRMNHGPGGKSEGELSVNQWLGVGIILLALYMVIKHTVGFNFIPEVNASMGYGILFVVGLLTSIHCVAMCGGINLSQCISYKTGNGEPGRLGTITPSLLYNAGRVTSYTVIGGIVGALGKAVSFSGAAKGAVAILSGVFMVIMGLNMLNIFPWLRKLNPRMPKIFGNKIHNSRGSKGPFYVGLLNGLMPCGPLQAMQLYALGTGSFTAGALSMFVFSLGTVPLLFGFGAISSVLSGKFTHKMLKVSAALVIVLGVVMVNRGFALSGVNIASAASGSGNVARVEGGVQVITTRLESGRYAPIVVQKGIPVRWTIQADQNSLNGCNNRLRIGAYNITDRRLVPGDNLIEFTPDTEGDFTYSCWMGMIRSTIKVVPDITNITSQDVQGSGGFSFGFGRAGNAGEGIIPTDEVAVGKIADGVQTVSVTVKDNKFSPAVVAVQKGVPVRWVIKGEELNAHNSTLIIPQYSASVDLEKGENELEFTPDNDFSFQCGTGLLNGYVKVVKDINKIDIDAIKSEVKNYQPSGRGFGGGGMSCH